MGLSAVVCSDWQGEGGIWIFPVSDQGDVAEVFQAKTVVHSITISRTVKPDSEKPVQFTLDGDERQYRFRIFQFYSA